MPALRTIAALLLASSVSLAQTASSVTTAPASQTQSSRVASGLAVALVDRPPKTIGDRTFVLLAIKYPIGILLSIGNDKTSLFLVNGRRVSVSGTNASPAAPFFAGPPDIPPGDSVPWITYIWAEQPRPDEKLEVIATIFSGQEARRLTDDELHATLLKSSQPFSVPFAKIPRVQPTTTKEIAAKLDTLATQPASQPAPSTPRLLNIRPLKDKFEIQIAIPEIHRNFFLSNNAGPDILIGNAPLTQANPMIDISASTIYGTLDRPPKPGDKVALAPFEGAREFTSSPPLTDADIKQATRTDISILPSQIESRQYQAALDDAFVIADSKTVCIYTSDQFPVSHLYRYNSPKLAPVSDGLLLFDKDSTRLLDQRGNQLHNFNQNGGTPLTDAGNFVGFVSFGKDEFQFRFRKGPADLSDVWSLPKAGFTPVLDPDAQIVLATATPYVHIDSVWGGPLQLWQKGKLLADLAPKYPDASFLQVSRNGTFYIAVPDKDAVRLVALKPTGEQLWETPLPSTARPDKFYLNVAADTEKRQDRFLVYYSDVDKEKITRKTEFRGFLLDTKGQIVSDFATMGVYPSGATLSRDGKIALVATTNPKNEYAGLDMTTGKFLWRMPYDDFFNTALENILARTETQSRDTTFQVFLTGQKRATTSPAPSAPAPNRLFARDLATGKIVFDQPVPAEFTHLWVSPHATAWLLTDTGLLRKIQIQP
jgi:outer membrane protein assembly factor BamB